MILPFTMTEVNEAIILGGFFTFGIFGSIFYYFARFFLFPDEDVEQRLGGKKEEVVKKTSFEPRKVVTLSDALQNSRRSLWRSGGGLPVQSVEDLEESLYMADLGPQTVTYLTEKVQGKLKNEVFDLDKVKAIFKDEMRNVFGEDQPEELLNAILARKSDKPFVIAIVGVNGAGKTTTIGKLAHFFSQKGKKVMVAAGDTFRAAAESQLNVWAERSGTLIFKAPDQTKDPGAVAFQAYEKALKEKADILLIDTAGRLHTQDNLMAELEKVKRVLQKKDADLPQALWMVLDANTGTNALYQAQAFHKALGLTGVIMTKVDGSSKAGTALGVRQTLEIPILMLGVGESIEDLRPFKPRDFVESLI